MREYLAVQSRTAMAHEESDDSDLHNGAFTDDGGEVVWETKAREVMQGFLVDVEYDEISGVIYTRGWDGGRADEFDSIDQLLSVLTDIGNEEWNVYVPYDDDGPVFDSEAESIAQELVDDYGVFDFFERVKPPSEGEELGTARDLLLSKAGLILQVDLSDINDELIKYLAKHPEKMHNMEPRKFEELVAALFRAKGYHVELTPATRDGGFDMRAFHRSDIGVCLTLIECKRYAPERRVSVGVVRGFYGVTRDEEATSGLVVTTSSFTKDAQSYQEKYKYRLQLADQAELQNWLHNHKRR